MRDPESIRMHTILYLNAVGEISGAERSLLAMLDALDRTCWSPVVAAPDGSLLAEAARRGARVLPLRLQPLLRPRTLPAAWSMMRSLRGGWRAVANAVAAGTVDLVHANSTAAMLYTLRLRGVPVVWQVRDLAPLGPWARLCYRRAAQVAVISQAVQQHLRRFSRDDHKISLLSPAVDTAHFLPAGDRQAVRRDLGLPEDETLIGLVAQFVPWKRHHLFLDVLEVLADRPWHAVLAGADLHHDAAYLASLHARLARPPLAGRVSWLPWQTDPAALFGALDLCVLTSQREPFGRVLAEALACAVPVVAVDEAGPREIIRHGATGLLAPAAPAPLAAAIAALLDDAALRAALGAAGRESVRQHYSLPVQRVALTTLYQRCLPEN